MKKVLDDEKVKYYTKRLIHYVTGVRKRNDLSQQELADMLEVSLSHYKKMEMEGYVNVSKPISAIETICSLGELENMNFYEFAYYLDNPNKLSFSEITLSANENSARKLYAWEMNLLTYFNSIENDIRGEFMEKFMSKTDPSKLLQIMKISLLLNDLVLEKLEGEYLQVFEVILEYIFVKFKKKNLTRLATAKEMIVKFFNK